MYSASGRVFPAVLHFQLKEIPDDFFVDIVSKHNFLTTTLQVSGFDVKCICVPAIYRNSGQYIQSKIATPPSLQTCGNICGVNYAI